MTVVVLADVRPNLGLRVVKLLVSACGVGDAVTDLERQQRDGPVPRPGPSGDGVGDREVDQLAGGVL
jgi:hypothetical protein